MANNIGKKFESKFAECWRKSFPNTFLYRIPDQQSQYYGSSANPCDFIAFVKGNLFLIETKSHKGNTVPWNAFRQYDRLLPFKDLKDVYPGVII